MKNKKIFLLLVVCSFLLPVILSSDDDWPMFRHDPQHTGYSDCEMPDELELLWKSERVGDYIFSSPAVANGKIYIGSNDGYLHSLNATTGELVWEYKIEDSISGEPIFSSPAVTNNKVYVESRNKGLLCHDATTGYPIWYEPKIRGTSPPTIFNGKVYVGSLDDYLYCLDADTGDLLWKYRTNNSIISSPAVKDDKVYFSSKDKYVYCLNADTGELIWKYKTDKEIFSSPTVVDDKVYIRLNDGHLYCLSARTGRGIWEYQIKIEKEILSSLAVAYGKIYVGSDDHYLYCIDAETKELLWGYETRGVIHSSPVVADNKVYIDSYDHYLYCIDAETGKPLKRKKTTNEITSSPVIADGKVYIGSRDGYLYCFGGKKVPDGSTASSPTLPPTTTTSPPTTVPPTSLPPTITPTIPAPTTPPPSPRALTLNKDTFEQGETVKIIFKYEKPIKPETISCKIYRVVPDEEDEEVYFSPLQQSEEREDHIWPWDQKDMNGTVVPPGKYRIELDANGTLYNESFIIKKTPFWHNYSFSIAVIILILFTSSSAVYLRKKRRSVLVYGYKEVRGIIPVLLTAPHAQSPNADLYTGEIVKKLANNTGAWGLISTISRNEIDYNRAEGRETPFRMRIDDLIRRGKIKYILDIHGMKERNLGDVELGTKMGTSASEEFISKLKETFEKEGIECTIERIGFTGGDIIEYHSDPPFVEAVQIEISRTLREHQRKKIVEILSRFIKRIVMEESDEK
ncbi:MAG: hypothetical protein B5M53_00385 [Candidatus Cloacimonas sp. 4484_209]|nr:MAG: hypothetical protein B5M53_00385 [Candidatus Cloacimonas sp. 4484_209]